MRFPPKRRPWAAWPAALAGACALACAAACATGSPALLEARAEPAAGPAAGADPPAGPAAVADPLAGPAAGADPLAGPAAVADPLARPGPPSGPGPTHPGGPPPAARPQDPAASAPVADPGTEIRPARESLDAELAAIAARSGLPALGALVLRGAEVVAEGATGLRRADRDVAVTPADAWHLGSCTKSMTATLAAVLVARGAIAWDTTVSEVFPDVAMDDGWRGATLEHLCSNTAGAPESLDAGGLWARLWRGADEPAAARHVLVEGVLARPPESPPGERYRYSNAGFAIAGAMLETRAGAPYETLLARHLFDPLGMEGAGFGAPGAGGERPDQPLGHVVQDGRVVPRDRGPGDDNPVAITPAGRVHAPLRAWARYAALHLAAARGEPVPEAFRGVDLAFLHRPRRDGYALGWLVSEPPWAGGPMLWHNGSNTMWYCEIGIFPEDDLAVLVATNTAHGETRTAVEDLLRALHRRFARGSGTPKPTPGRSDGRSSR